MSAPLSDSPLVGEFGPFRGIPTLGMSLESKANLARASC